MNFAQNWLLVRGLKRVMHWKLLLAFRGEVGWWCNRLTSFAPFRTFVFCSNSLRLTVESSFCSNLRSTAELSSAKTSLPAQLRDVLDFCCCKLSVIGV